MGLPAFKIEAEVVVEERLARVESHVEHIQSDISEMKIDMREMRQDIRRLDAKVDAGFQRLDSKIDAGLKAANDKMDAGFLRVDAKFDAMDAKMEAGFQRLDSKFDEIKKDSKSDLKWIMGMFGAGVLFLAGLMYFLAGRPTAPAVELKTKEVGSISAPAPAPGGRTPGQASAQ